MTSRKKYYFFLFLSSKQSGLNRMVASSVLHSRPMDWSSSGQFCHRFPIWWKFQLVAAQLSMILLAVLASATMRIESVFRTP